MIQTASHFVKIYAAGPGYGESIIINISDKILIGLDAGKWAFLRNGQGDSLMSQLLETKFDHVVWAITHYHYDHFLGTNGLLNCFWDKITQVILPQTYSTSDISHIIEFHNENRTGRKGLGKRAKNEYQKLRQLVSRYDDKIISFSGKYSFFSNSIRANSGEKKRLTIDFHGPSQKEVDSIQGGIFFDINKKKEIKKSRKFCNQSSYILDLNYGKFRGLFLGDAPISRSIRITKPNSISFLKVSHHGSKTGTDDNLLKVLCNGLAETKTALITPYSPSGLPKKKILDTLKEFDFRLIETELVANSQQANKRIEKEGRENVKISVTKSMNPRSSYVEQFFPIL